MMHLDLSAIPVIDNHIHIFASQRQACPFENCFTISSFPQEPRHLQNTMVVKMITAEMRRFLDMPGAPDAEVLLERDKRLADAPRPYIQALMADAGLSMLICDLDAPISAYWTGRYRADGEAEAFIETVEPEVGVGCIVRIEIACNRLLEQHLPFEAFLQAFRDRMLENIQKYNAIAIKSVIGYFTGLAVKNVDEAEAAEAYRRFLANREDGQAEKTWRDYMLHQGRELCRAQKLPLHIHTGWGDTPYCDLRRMNPALLYDFLLDEPGMEVPTVLLHAGFPYSRELAILASHFPQVYVDVSEMLPYAGRAIETVLPQMMDIAPFTKILYGSDGGGIVEPVWFAAVYVRRALARVLEDCVDKGAFDEAYAMQVAEWMLYRNALRLHPKLEAKFGERNVKKAT